MRRGGNRRGRKQQSSANRDEQREIDRDMVPDRLPSIVDQLSTGIVLRFITTGGAGGTTSQSVSFQNLLDSWLIAGQPAVGYQLFDFIKIHSVTVRGIPSAASQVSVTVGVEFPGLVTGLIGAGNQKSETSLGSAKPAIVCVKPGKDTLAGSWQASSSANAFVVRATNSDNTVCTGAVIDVKCSFKNSADVNPAAVASAIAGATAGNIYFGGIDGGRLAATWARSAFVPRI